MPTLTDGPCCANGGPYGGRQWQLWHRFHSEQARLSANSRHIISSRPDHALNESDPDLVIAAIREVVRSARAGTLLSCTEAAGG